MTSQVYSLGTSVRPVQYPLAQGGTDQAMPRPKEYRYLAKSQGNARLRRHCDDHNYIQGFERIQNPEVEENAKINLEKCGRRWGHKIKTSERPAKSIKRVARMPHLKWSDLFSAVKAGSNRTQ